jgi:TetR/AcrR family transcriptional repressor of mexJK operon
MIPDNAMRHYCRFPRSHGSRMTEQFDPSDPLSTTVADVPLAGRERILLEARARFVGRGFADVTMQDIADSVGLTKAAVYYHFGDKEGLFEAVFFAEMERVVGGIAAELARSDALHTQLEGIARFLLLTDGEHLGRLLTDLDRYVSAERRRALGDRVPNPYQAIRPAFERATATGELREVDLDVTISLYFGMIFGQIRRSAHGRQAPASPEALATAIADLTIKGIAAH